MGAGVSVRTEIAADFRRGSFAFLVSASVEHADGVSRLLGTVTMSDVLHFLGLTGGGGVIGLLGWLRGRKVAKVEQLPDNQARVIAQDGAATVVHGGTVLLFNNSTVRLHLDGVVDPLRRDGITELRIGQEGQTSAVVPSESVDSFEPPIPEGELLQDRESREFVQLVTVQLLPGRKWKLRLADGTTFGSALDSAYERRVATHSVVFGAGDSFEVDLRTVVTRTPDGQLHAKREVSRVVRHIPAPTQIAFRLQDGSQQA